MRQPKWIGFSWWTSIMCLVLLVTSCTSSKRIIRSDMAQAVDASKFDCQQLQEAIAYLNGDERGIDDRSDEHPTSVKTTIGGISILPVNLTAGISSAFRSGKNKSEKDELMDKLIGSYKSQTCSVYQLASADVDQLSLSKKGTFSVSALDRLEFPSRCSKPSDRKKRTYVINTQTMEQSEYLKFFTVGDESTSINIKVSHLLYGDVRLPKFKIATRKGGHKRGLWVQRLSNGDRAQLSYLAPNFNCNTLGRSRVEYLNTWVEARG